MDKIQSTHKGLLSCKSISKEKNENQDSSMIFSGSPCHSSTLINQKLDSDLDDYYPCTQDEFENRDVLWDWNSPQAKQKKQKRRLILKQSQSPKLPIRRHPSNNNVMFEKLKDELLALRNDISIPDNEDCLMLSPVEEEKFKNSPQHVSSPIDRCKTPEAQSQIGSTSLTAECDNNELQEFFNDSADEDLFLFSQQLENNLDLPKTHTSSNKPVLNTRQTTGIKRNIYLQNEESPKRLERDFKFNDDSFDMILQKMDEEITQRLPATQINDVSSIKNTKAIQRTKSEVQYTTNTKKIKFNRTQSFELPNIENESSGLSQTAMDIIEKKRKEALAKLVAKKRNEKCTPIELTNTQMMCSPEEIEQKRLQALAKREAKRQQEIIQQKRQEALKKLELNRQKSGINCTFNFSKKN